MILIGLVVGVAGSYAWSQSPAKAGTADDVTVKDRHVNNTAGHLAGIDLAVPIEGVAANHASNVKFLEFPAIDVINRDPDIISL